MRVKVIMIDGTRHDLENCQEVFLDGQHPTVVRVMTGNNTYAFNWNVVKYVQKIEENDEKETEG